MSKKSTGAERIYTAGEKEYLAWLDRKNRGVPVNRRLQEEMAVMIAELGLTGYDFPYVCEDITKNSTRIIRIKKDFLDFNIRNTSPGSIVRTDFFSSEKLFIPHLGYSYYGKNCFAVWIKIIYS